MKKFLGLMLMPALACGLALAQSNMPSNTTQTNDQVTNSTTKTITGCVQERDGSYFLTKNKHNKGGVELMGSDDVKSQVGHKVSVTGTPTVGMASEHHASTDPEDPMGTTHDSGQSADRANKDMRALNVTSIQSLADTCEKK
jgi:hypothetical protein